jgi:hypothetical protein
MIDAGGLLKVLHALAGVAFVSGLVGRWIVLAAAQRASSLRAVTELAAAARPFERMVIVGSAVVLILGVGTAIAQGRPFLGPLQSAPSDWLFVSVLLYLSIIPLVPLVFVPRGRTLANALEDARAGGAMTPAVTAALADPVVRAAHVYELAAVTVVLILMISKPF